MSLSPLATDAAPSFLGVSTAHDHSSILSLLYCTIWCRGQQRPDRDVSAAKTRRRVELVLGRISSMHTDKSDLERQKAGAGFGGVIPG